MEIIGSNRIRSVDQITKRLGRIPSFFIKTLTFDNDNAFARHQRIAETLEVDTYFIRPYTSQHKGTVENRIGVILQFFPKGTGSSRYLPAAHQNLRAIPEISTDS